MPIEKKKRLVKIVIQDVMVNFSDAGIKLNIKSQVESFKKKLNISAMALGDLVYNEPKGTFHFQHQEIEFSDLTFTGVKIPEKWKNVAFAGTEWAIGSYLDRFPVYTLEEDIKGKAVKLFLDSVEVKDNVIIAHLTFWKFTKTVMLYAIAFVVFLAFLALVITKPESLGLIVEVVAVGADAMDVFS